MCPHSRVRAVALFRRHVVLHCLCPSSLVPCSPIRSLVGVLWTSLFLHSCWLAVHFHITDVVSVARTSVPVLDQRRRRIDLVAVCCEHMLVALVFSSIAGVPRAHEVCRKGCDSRSSARPYSPLCDGAIPFHFELISNPLAGVAAPPIFYVR